ncbi:Rhodopsin domain-containing protein [Madurella fahalii]|uniref:Rhodopsin domain-containing protein n=1 Tax=Madurella fahalii TaxID=1157608 RepID=A0ABQ0GL53_9PEZI
MDSLPPGVDLSTIPLAPNPNGDPPNFAGGPSLEPATLATGVAFTSISALFVMLRLYTVIQKSRRVYWDDCLCVVAEVAVIAQWAMFYSVVRLGLGKHSWDVPVTAITPRVLQYQLANTMLAMVSHFSSKASILSFFIRVFGISRWVRLVCYGLIVLTFLSYTSFEIVTIVLCIPRRGEEWDNNQLARCATSAPASIMVGVCTVVADVIMFIVPFIIISGLHLDRQKKRGLTVVFLVGFLIVIASIVGLAYRIIVTRGTEDPVWNGAAAAITAYMEVFGTIIVACAPALSSFWINIFSQSRLFSTLLSARERLFRSKQSTATLGHNISTQPPVVSFGGTQDHRHCAYCDHSKRSATYTSQSSEHELVCLATAPNASRTKTCDNHKVADVRR